MQKKHEESTSLEGLKRGVSGVSDLVPLPELPAHPHRSNILYIPGFNSEDLALVPRVRKEQIEVTKEIGHGAFGTVWEGYVDKLYASYSPRTKVAIKVSDL